MTGSEIGLGMVFGAVIVALLVALVAWVVNVFAEEGKRAGTLLLLVILYFLIALAFIIHG